jgi:tRNA A37 threonylcarbamoyladenosine synthetase subunit TsaC/SUA5/YrdC
MDLEEYYIDDERVLKIVPEVIANGHDIAVQFHDVYAWISAGFDRPAIKRVYEVKPRDRSQPFAIQHGLEITQFLVDYMRLTKEHGEIITDTVTLREAFGNTSFLRIPIKPSVYDQIPEWLRKGAYVQVFSFYGSEHAFNLERAIQQRLALMYRSQLFGGSIMITSLNNKDQRSILDKIEAAQFCKKNGIPLVVHNRIKATGSYPIIQLDENGPRLVRGNFIPSKIKDLL